MTEHMARHIKTLIAQTDKVSLAECLVTLHEIERICEVNIQNYALGCTSDCGCSGAQWANKCGFMPDCPKCRVYRDSSTGRLDSKRR